VVFDQIYLVSRTVPGLTLERLSGGERSLYSVFENDYGVRMIHAEERLRAVAADLYSAGLLGVASGAPLLLVERTAYTYGNKPVEWRRGLYCTNHHIITGTTLADPGKCFNTPQSARRGVFTMILNV
jgi:GntR family transcriptional regulator